MSIHRVYKIGKKFWILYRTERYKEVEKPYSWTSLVWDCCRRWDAGITLLYWPASEADPAWTDVGLSFHASLLVCAKPYDTDPDDTEPLPPAAYALASVDLSMPYDTGRVDDELLPENSPLVRADVQTAAPPTTFGSEYSYKDIKPDAQVHNVEMKMILL